MPITLIGQAGIAGVNHPTPQTVTYSSTANNTLLAVAHDFNSTTSNFPSAITDTAGNSWNFSTADTAGNNAVPPTEQAAATFSTDFAGYVLKAAAVTSVTVALGASGTNFWRLAIAEFAGIAGFSNSFAGLGASSASFTMGPVILPVPGCLVVAAASSASGTPSLPSGWTQFTASGGAVGFLLPNGAGQFSATWSTTVASAWEGVMTVFLPPYVPPQVPYTPPRRRSSRAVVQFIPVVTTNAPATPPPPGMPQPRPALTPPRRRPARAVMQFIPVVTVNAAPAPGISGSLQPLTAQPAPRRRPSRAVVQFIPVRTVNAPAGTGILSGDDDVPWHLRNWRRR